MRRAAPQPADTHPPAFLCPFHPALCLCVQTQVGDSETRGISGGERKRLTTAEIMVGQQSVVFMVRSQGALCLLGCLRISSPAPIMCQQRPMPCGWGDVHMADPRPASFHTAACTALPFCTAHMYCPSLLPFCTALLYCPPVQDEISTGLDSATAYSVIKTFRCGCVLIGYGFVTGAVVLCLVMVQL